MLKIHKQYQLVEQAIRYIKANLDKRPSLADLAAALGVSDYHLQRVFTEWAGISPKQFMQYLTKESVLKTLADSKSLLDTTLDAGLSSPSRLHDLMVRCVAMSPNEIKQKGQGVLIRHALGATPFGTALIGWTDKGICHFAFTDDEADALRELMDAWPNATFVADLEKGVRLIDAIFTNSGEPVAVWLNGTNFQLKVWEALLKTQPEEMLTYSDLARQIGLPKAQRAVGSAVAKNKIAFLIPCHRVIREGGEIGNYRWGAERKVAMYVWEKEKGNRR